MKNEFMKKIWNVPFWKFAIWKCRSLLLYKGKTFLVSPGVTKLGLPINFQLAKVSGLSQPNNDNDNIMKDILDLGLDRDLGFSRGYQGHWGHHPHDDDNDEKDGDEVERNDKDDNNNKDDNNDKSISVLKLDRDM